MIIDKIYAEYGNLVFNVALQYVQNIEDAEEITQDVFVSVHQNIGEYRQDANIKTWIYRITINKSLDHIKAKNCKKRFGFLTSIFISDMANNHQQLYDFNHPGILLEQKETLKRIFAAINQLSPNQRTALILHKIDALPQSEISIIMGLSPKAVESLIQRAKSSLKTILFDKELGSSNTYQLVGLKFT